MTLGQNMHDLSVLNPISGDELVAALNELLEAERADDEGRINEIKVIDPRKGALTQIFEEFKPQGVPVVIESVVEKKDNELISLNYLKKMR